MSYPYKVVLFDLDDTLIDSRKAYRNAYRVLSERNPNVYQAENEEEIEDIYRFVFRINSAERNRAYPSLCERWGIDNAPPSAHDFREMWLMAYAANAAPFPWTREVLDSLHRKGIRVGIITNGNIHRQSRKLLFADLLGDFEDIIISASTGTAKPSAAIFRLAAQRLGVRVQDCLFVGDNPATDISGAKSAGMDCLWLTRGEHTENATYAAPDTRFLLDLFR